MTEPPHRLPDLFICGFTKCATSSLHDWLVQHPQISGGVRKELEFLYDRDNHFFRPEHSVLTQGLAGYAALFPDAPDNALWLDSTPAYAHHETARKTIAAMAHRPPVIFITRDPVDQITSTYHYFSNNKSYIDASISIEMFFEMVLDGRASSHFPQDHLRNALDWAAFGYWLALWRRDLGPERVIHLEMRHMLSDPANTVAALLGRLGLETNVPLFFDGSNETYFVRNRLLQSLNTAIRGKLPKGALYETARRVYRRLNTTPHKPGQSAREVELRAALAQAISDRETALLERLQPEL